MHSGFREDLNLLRAVAVVGVVAYHFGLTQLSGGFVGVDVFFVVSGYLMTQMITGQIEAGRFGIIRFYLARLRRLLPALLVLCVVLMLGGLAFIDPLTLTRIAQEAFAALLAYSNILFWRQSGYFAPDADTHWLLHTWSLSVEWQFYILYPVFLVVVMRLWRGAAALGTALAVVAALSLAASIWLSANYPTPAFYLLPTRAWELLIGGIVLLLEKRVMLDRGVALALEGIGFAMIVAAMFVFDTGTIWPGANALLPVLGTAIVIFARSQAVAIALRPIRFIGLWSYSIYLWHWPIIVATGYLELPRSAPVIAAALALTLAAAAISYQFVEEPVRRERFAAGGKRIAAAAAILVSVGLAGWVALADGLPARRGDAGQMLAYAEAQGDWAFPTSCNALDRSGRLRPCVLGDATTGGTLMIGDSHAEQYYPRAAALGGLANRIVFATGAACLPIPGLDLALPGNDCASFFDQVMDLAENGGFARVVISSLWNVDPAYGAVSICSRASGVCSGNLVEAEQIVAGAMADEISFIKRLQAKGVDVVIVLPTPHSVVDVPVELAKRVYLPWLADPSVIDREELAARTGWMGDWLSAVAAETGAALVDPNLSMCSESTCPAVDAEGAPIFIDSNHLRASYAARQVTFLDDYLR